MSWDAAPRARRLLGALALAVAPLALSAQSSPLERRVSVQFRDVSLRDALDRVMAVARVILVAHAGTLVNLMGYDWFFIATLQLALPGLLLPLPYWLHF